MSNSGNRPGRWKPMTLRQRLADETNPYPCLVCGETFKSIRELREHPHGRVRAGA